MIRQLYSPCVAEPWWSPECCARLDAQTAGIFLEMIGARIVCIAATATCIMESCATVLTHNEESGSMLPMLRGLSVARPTAHLTSAFLLPGRLFHKLLTLLVFICRALPASWLQSEFGVQPQVESDLFGFLPNYAARRERRPAWLGYEHADPRTGQRTLVPLMGEPIAGHKFCVLRQHLGSKTLMIVALQDGSWFWIAGCSSSAHRVKTLCSPP